MRIPQITEKTAKRQVAAAKAQVTLARHGIDTYCGSKPGASRELCDAWRERLVRAEARLEIVEQRLEAVQSQSPQRWIPGVQHPVARGWSGIDWTPDEDEAFKELGL